jgi:hypothetical protein
LAAAVEQVGQRATAHRRVRCYVQIVGVVAGCINPATGETIGAYTEAGEAEARRAIAAALKAFKKTDLRENRRLRAKVMAPSQAGSARSPDPETRGKTRRPL